MKNEEILISIGLPVYNGEKYIREALDSVLSQTYTNFELIISDNCSTDKTEEICREYTKKDPRVQYVRHDKNRGGYFNFDYCMQKAKGPYFTFLSHDDALEKRFLEETVNYLTSHKECVLVSGDFEFIDGFGSHIDNLELSRTRENLPWGHRLRELFKYPTSSKIYLLGCGLMRTDMVKKASADRFSPKMFKGGDMAILCRIAIAGQMVSIPEILRKYRVHQNSYTKIEQTMVNKKSIPVRRFILFVNVWEIRFDQMRVLLQSQYPLSQKLDILWWVYKQYFTNFLKRLIRLPKKIWYYLR